MVTVYAMDYKNCIGVYFENGSGHEVAASYSGLYEECDQRVWPVFLLEQLIICRLIGII